MIIENHDLWLWTYLCVFGFFAARAVHRQLYAIRDISEVTELPPQYDGTTQQTEDGLKQSSLLLLAQSPNPDIRAASIKIIRDSALERFPIKLMLSDIAGKDEERRNHALTCLVFLKLNGPKLRPILREYYDAIINCLCNLLPEATETETGILESDRLIRSEHYSQALNCLAFNLPFGFEEAVNAGLVTKWLSQYPFGGSTLKEERKRRIKQLLATEYDDPCMLEVVRMAESRQRSRQQLEACGLLDKQPNEPKVLNEEHTTTQIQIFYGSNEDESENSDSTTNSVRQRRLREEGLEELAWRRPTRRQRRRQRRRREAMVLGENEMPLIGGDIIEQNERS